MEGELRTDQETSGVEANDDIWLIGEFLFYRQDESGDEGSMEGDVGEEREEVFE